MQQLSIAIFVLGNILLSLIVLYNNPKSWTNKLFTILISCITIYLFVNSELYLVSNLTIRTLLAKGVMAVAAWINLFVLLFLSNFPSNKLRTPKKPLYILTSITAVLSLLAFTNLIFKDIEFTPTGQVNPEPGLAMPLFGLHTLILVALGIWKIFKTFRKSKGITKERVKYILLGFVVLFTLIITFNFLFVVILKNSFFVPFLPIYILIFNIIITYAIIRHRLLEIRFLVAKAATFTILIIFSAGIYTLTLFNIINSLPENTHTPLSVIAALIVAFTFEPLKNLIQRITFKLFFKTTYNTSDLLEELGDIATSSLSLNTITNKTLSKLTSTLHITKSAFLFLDTNKETTTVNNGYDQIPKLNQTNIKDIAQKANSNPMAYEDIENEKIRALFNNNEISLALPLTNSGKTYGLLVLGEKKSGDIYSNQDIQMLDIFAPQISVAIQNSLAYEKIKHFNKILKEEVKEATQKLRKANSDLRHLDKLKDEFVYVATHELKNPVTAMRGYLSMLDEGSFGKIPDKLKDPIHQINQSNQQLVKLVNDLLQIARAEAETIKISLQPVDVCEVTDQIIKSVIPLAKQKDLSIEFLCDEEELMVEADPDRFKEVLNNLLTNAIKYSEKGKISVSFAKEGNAVVTHVKDEGVGIPKADQKRIFTRFFRVEEEVAKGIPGSGLGLFIVRQLVEKMNGKIWFTSKYGKGTTFSFSLPKAKK